MIRFLVILLYIAVFWYGLSTRSNVGYIVMIVGVIVGLVINYFNYQINLKGKLNQMQENNEKVK